MRGALAALAAALAVAAACSGLASPPAVLVVGAVYPLSGPQAAGGREELAGVQAALELARRGGWLGSRRVRLEVMDAQTPDAAVAGVRRLVEVRHAPVVIGTYGSTLAEAAAAQADQLHTVYWETGAVADSVVLKHPYVFRTVAGGSTLGQMAVEFTGKVLMPRLGRPAAQARAAIVYVDDVYGRSVAQGEVARAAQLGIPVVDRIGYDPYRYDAVAIVQRLARARPDFLWDVSYLDDGIAIWQQVLRQRVPLQAAVGTSSAFCMPEFGRRLGADAVGVFAADKPDDEVNIAGLQPDGRALLAQARAVYAAQNGGKAMSIPAVAGFTGGWTLFHEVLPRVTGKVTADEIRHAAFQVDVPVGASINGGGVRFGSAEAADAGQNRRAAAVVGQWVAVEQMRVVYPPAFATATPLPAA
ncbi:MAG TPA: ABC transporter substrate-binding protein [Candidatus Acidoferrales bacterium]|nr:ABC transporter substrate-binding protein [Candidatus Acidoferrales bacterium]